MRNITIKKTVIGGLLGTTMLVAASAAFAQTAAPVQDASVPPATSPAVTDNSAQTEDIVVTAQKRSESIQKVPISMQALSSETLSQHQVQSFDDYTKLLPSASFQTFGPGQSQLFFRGIVSSSFNPFGSLPTAGVYLDEVPVTTTGYLLDVHVYDVARVEALSGPQGTLYGASSLAGTLRIITNKPDPSKVTAGYDISLNKFGAGNFGGTAEGFVNVPLNDRVAVRIVGFYDKEGGYIDNTLASRTYQRPHTVAGGAIVNSPITINNANAVQNNFNDAVSYGGRIALGIELNDNWTITPGIAAQEQHTHGTFLYDPRAGDLKVHDFLNSSSEDKWYQASLAVQGKVGNWDVIYSGGYMQRHNQATADYSYYTVAYDTVPDYNYFQTASGRNIDPTQFVSRRNNYSKQTHELRVSSPTGKRLQVTAGLFYQRQANDFHQDYFIPGLASAVQAPSYQVYADDIFLTDAKRIDRDYAVFAQGDFKITPNLTLTGGIRGFKYNNSVVGFSGGAGTAKRLCGGLWQPGCVSIDKTAKGSGETHKASLSWQIDPTKMVYATYSTGFRPGGINRPVGFAPYQSDTLDNYEIGWKTSWLDRKLRINGAVYHEVWDGVQYALPGANGVVSIVNAGNAHVWGVEADLAARLGHLTLSTGGAYNDAKLSTPFCNLVNGVRRCNLGVAAPAGTRLPTQPRLKLNATARYDFTIGGIDAFGQAALLHQSGTTSLLKVSDNALLGGTNGFTTFDFSVGGALSNHTTFEFFIQNAFDERGALSRNSQCVLSICYAAGRVYPVKPQQFGIKFGQRF